MGRDVPYDENEICCICGKVGAYDFMGDLICENCLDDTDVETESSPPNDSTGDLINKIETLNSYLTMWLNGNTIPIELGKLVEEVGDYIDKRRGEV